MKKILPIVSVIVLLVVVAIYFVVFRTTPSWTKQQILNHQVETNLAGSGYPDLEGKFIEYEYVDFGSFRLAIYDNKIKWRGEGGYFDGIVSQVEPQISKVADGVYFLSWVFGNNGGDNVVVNFNTGKVFAHLRSGNANADSPADFEMIHGTVHCGASVDCPFPEGDPISMVRMVLKLNSNTKKFNLPPIFESKKPLIPAHIEAREELKGSTLQYNNEKGENVTVELNDDSTNVSMNGQPSQTYQTNVTKIGEGIYFISWLGNEAFGEHIVYNKNTGQVFDHMTADLERKEVILSANNVASMESEN